MIKSMQRWASNKLALKELAEYRDHILFEINCIKDDYVFKSKIESRARGCFNVSLEHFTNEFQDMVDYYHNLLKRQ